MKTITKLIYLLTSAPSILAPDAGLLLKRDDGKYNASDHDDRSNHARPPVTKSADRLPGHGAGVGVRVGLLNVHKEVFQTGLREISFLTS